MQDNLLAAGKPLPGLRQPVLPNARNGNTHRLQMLLPALLLNDSLSLTFPLYVGGMDLLSRPLTASVTRVLCIWKL